MNCFTSSPMALLIIPYCRRGDCLDPLLGIARPPKPSAVSQPRSSPLLFVAGSTLKVRHGRQALSRYFSFLRQTSDRSCPPLRRSSDRSYPPFPGSGEAKRSVSSGFVFSVSTAAIFFFNLRLPSLACSQNSVIMSNRWPSPSLTQCHLRNLPLLTQSHAKPGRATSL